MSDLARDLRAKGKDIIALAAGEADFDTPDHIRVAAKAAMDRGETRYAPVTGIPELKTAIVHKFLDDNNLVYAEDQIIVGTGGKQILYNALAATLDEGDEVIIPAPFWVSYPDMVRLNRGTPVIVETTIRESFKLGPEALEESITPKTKWLVLNSPSNPTGAVYTRGELRSIADVLLRFPHVNILTDDIYEALCFDARFFSIVQIEPSLASRTLIVNGVSKAYAMTGWRIGYGAGPVGLIKGMAKIQGQSTTSASTISQWAALSALTGPQDFLGKWAKEFKLRRDLVLNHLAQIDGLRCAKPEGAFYVFPNCEKLLGRKAASGKTLGSDTDFTLALLEQEGVATVPGSAFGSPGHFRISYALDKLQLVNACRRIAKFCDTLK